MEPPPGYGRPVYQQWVEGRLCNVYKDPYADDEHTFFVDWNHPLKTASQDALEQQLELDDAMQDMADFEQVSSRASCRAVLAFSRCAAAQI
jgi:hypothetical protein